MGQNELNDIIKLIINSLNLINVKILKSRTHTIIDTTYYVNSIKLFRLKIYFIL